MPVRKAKPATKVNSHTRRTPAGKRAQVENERQGDLGLDTPRSRADNPVGLDLPTTICRDAGNILKARGEQYENKGGERQFHKVAAAFSAITGIEIEGHHAALVLQLTKMCRMENFYQTNNSLHYDSALDGAAYVGLVADEINTQVWKNSNAEE